MVTIASELVDLAALVGTTGNNLSQLGCRDPESIHGRPPYVNWPAGKQAVAERYGQKKPFCREVGTWQLSLPGILFATDLGEVITSTRPCAAEAFQAGGRGSGAKASRLNQSHLIAACSELPALITLNNHTATGFDPDHTGTNPAKGCGLEHLDHISGLKIQLHVREGKTAGQTRTEVDQSTIENTKLKIQSWFINLDGVSVTEDIERAVEDLNPRHQVLETCVLPTELTAQSPMSPVGGGEANSC